MTDRLRYELKFVLDERQMARALGWLASDTRLSARYPPRVVNSVYYDTADFCSLKDNLYGISDRVKHRLRWYGGDCGGQADGVCLEVKRRSGRLNSKNRVALPELSNTLLRESHHQVRQQLVERVKGSQGFEKIAMYFPTLQVKYAREYFEDLNGVRITLDKEILFFQTPLNGRLFFGHGVRYPWRIMEIKFPRHFKSNVSETIRRLRMTPKRHSKYAAGLAAFGLTTYF